MRRWRHALLDYLTAALEAGLVSAEVARPELIQLLEEHRDRWWKAQVVYYDTKDEFLGYISRYLRRPPLAEYRLLPSTGDHVIFLTKDKKQNRIVNTTYSTADFIARLADQVPDKYRHGVRYFGLLAPRSSSKSYEVFLALLGERRLPRLRRFRWAASVQWAFGRNPLHDSQGKLMHWVGRIAPIRLE